MENTTEDIPLYKYLNLESFLYLMGTRRLRFSKITDWPDKFEGSSYKISSKIFYDGKHVSFENIWGSCWTKETDIEACHSSEGSLSRANTELREHGSAAMWGSYCSSCGIRVKSTLRKIEDAVKTFTEKSNSIFRHGDVVYSADIQPRKDETALLHKHIPFRYESEYRFLLVDKDAELKEAEVPIGDPFTFFDEMLVGSTTKNNKWLVSIIHQALAASVGLGGNSTDRGRFAKISQLFGNSSENLTISYIRFNTFSEVQKALEPFMPSPRE